MKEYGQFCPLAQAAQILCERWTLLIVRELTAGSTRFNELQKGVPLMSPTLLSTRLKQLEASNIIIKDGMKGDHSYHLTLAGIELRPVVELMGSWGHRWARSNLAENDLDASLLMWDMRRSVNPLVFPKKRLVIQFEYFDAPLGARDWWLISENEEIDLCLNDPGFDVNVMVRSNLAAMTAVWTCQRSFNDSVKFGDIEVKGDPKLKNKMQDWLCSSPLSKLGASGQTPELDWKNNTARE